MLQEILIGTYGVELRESSTGLSFFSDLYAEQSLNRQEAYDQWRAFVAALLDQLKDCGLELSVFRGEDDFGDLISSLGDNRVTPTTENNPIHNYRFTTDGSPTKVEIYRIIDECFDNIYSDHESIDSQYIIKRTAFTIQELMNIQNELCNASAC